MSLAKVFNERPDRRYLMFGGKGGLGKTSLSAATGYYLASHGKRVLVFSVDPQASLTDVFETDIFGRGPVEIMPNLYAQEIDADRRMKQYQEEVREKIRDLHGLEEIPEEIDRYIEATGADPAMEEGAIFDAVVDIIAGGEYDYYIYDMVPLGHCLYYLRMASVYNQWIDKITGLRKQMREYEEIAALMKRKKELPDDPVLTELYSIQERINKSSGALADERRTAFFFVLTPEEMAIRDTKRAIELFSQHDVPFAGCVVNRILPDELKYQNIPEFLRSRLVVQEQYLKLIQNEFPGQIVASIPEMDRDVTGLEMVEKLAGVVFGDE